MNLREARVGEQRAAFVRAPARRDVRAFGVGRKEEDVAVAAGAEDDGVGKMSVDFAGHQVARDDAAGALPSMTIRSSISVRAYISIEPALTCRSSA